MAALYSHTTRSTGTTLTAAIYNTDHQNHIDNGVPAQLDDYSANATQMQSTVDPGEASSESLATSLAGELERLRFAIKECKTAIGLTSAQWYSTPTNGGVALPGMITPYAGATEPTGWLFCYGQAVSRTTYAALFAITSTTYGVGDGSTTFNLPDLRGRVVAGQDDMGGSSANRLTGVSGGVDGDVLGGAGGVETHTLTEAQLASHTHTLAGSAPLINVAGGVWQGGATGGVHGIDGNVTLNTAGSGTAHNNVQPTLILNYLIKT